MSRGDLGEARIVAKRVTVGDRRRQRRGQRFGLGHVETDLAQRIALEELRREAAQRRPETEHDVVAAVVHAAMVDRRVFGDAHEFVSREELVAPGVLHVRAQCAERRARLDGGVASAVQTRHELSAQRRIARRASHRRVRAARTAARRRRPRFRARSATSSSCSSLSSVIEPFGRKPTPGTSCATSAQSSRARSASCSSRPSARPLTQTSPKLRTVAPLGTRSRSRCTTLAPRANANERVHRAEDAAADHDDALAFERRRRSFSTVAKLGRVTFRDGDEWVSSAQLFGLTNRRGDFGRTRAAAPPTPRRARRR